MSMNISLKRGAKRFSIRNKLLIIFTLLVLSSISIMGILSVAVTHKAVVEKVETHLIDKALDVTEIIDNRIVSFFQMLEGIARMPQLRSDDISYEEKAELLNKEAAFHSNLIRMNITELDGTVHSSGRNPYNRSDREWFKTAVSGKRFVSQPIYGRSDGKFIGIFSIPIYGNGHHIIGVLYAVTEGNFFSEIINDIVVGETGECFLIDNSGTVVASKDISRVENMENPIKEAQKDHKSESTAVFLQHVLSTDKNSVGYYTYSDISYIASYASMEAADWKVIIKAPINEFLGSINSLRISIFLSGFIILIITIVAVFFIAGKLINPIKTTVDALQNIAQGDGDLTVRLPVAGNDEITDLSGYFNQTISKIGASIKNIDENSNVMQTIGDELSSNMTETASAVNEINANIEGVKQQAMTQAASVTETAGTIEEIIRTIEQLNTSIEQQSASVVQSSAAVEQMVANIGSITKSLEKSDSLIKTLAQATSEGKKTLVNSNTVTQKIAEESGGLIEASNVIQNIASQTNLLAMNAAIEAAHAGEAGKGFAVVADEIRKLAEESSAQGKTITSTLKTLSDEISLLSESSKIVEEKFNAIFNLSENVRGMSAELTSAMREQENGSKEVLSAIKTISTVTSEVQNGSQEMLTGSKGVSKEMRKLDGLTLVIKDSMNEMSAGVSQINNAVQEVNELAQKNKASIKSLAEEVGNFKV